MGRIFSEKKLIIASHNQGKVEEIRALVLPLGIEVVSAGECDLPEPEETGTTYIENAELKARAAADASGLPSLSDDSGLSVTALGGDPGIYSARWAGPEKNFATAMQRVESELQKQAVAGTTDRSASFVCALTICWPDGHTESVEGHVHGNLVWPPRGDNGFGYDPIFVPNGHHQTFGEVNPEWKHSVSHRAIAFKKLLKQVGLDRAINGDEDNAG